MECACVQCMEWDCGVCAWYVCWECECDPLLWPVALELEASYLKVWVRRAQAHEALEKYEEALEGEPFLAWNCHAMF